ncbi:hypothetical protein PUN4_560007 [Paraburkholderia unamae]|nr:hypothetical protein PUN4_560007 [Paraburkholderia unamae]
MVAHTAAHGPVRPSGRLASGVREAPRNPSRALGSAIPGASGTVMRGPEVISQMLVDDVTYTAT